MNRIVQMSWPIRRQPHIIIITFRSNESSYHRIIISEPKQNAEQKLMPKMWAQVICWAYAMAENQSMSYESEIIIK